MNMCFSSNKYKKKLKFALIYFKKAQNSHKMIDGQRGKFV